MVVCISPFLVAGWVVNVCWTYDKVALVIVSLNDVRDSVDPKGKRKNKRRTPAAGKFRLARNNNRTNEHDRKKKSPDYIYSFFYPEIRLFYKPLIKKIV